MPGNAAEVVTMLKDVFASRQFMRRLANTRENWIQIERKEAALEKDGFFVVI